MDWLPTILCILSSIIIVIGLTISYIYIKAKKKKFAALSILISIAIIISMVGGISYYFNNIPLDLEYKIIIKTNTTGNYTLYVPYLDNSELRSELEIISGNGIFEFISIEQGQIKNSDKAIKITSQSNFTIYGKIQDSTRPEMSLATNDNVNFGNLHWFWYNKTIPLQNVSIRIFASVSGYNFDEDWQTVNDHNFSFIFIENGWNKVYIRKEKGS